MSLDPPSNAAEQVRSIRQDLRLSQAGLAAALGVSKLTVLRWEHGRVRPGPVLWERLLGMEPRAATAAQLHGVAEPANELVGRSESVREVIDLLETHRLITLTGPGGVGKTRLALAVASDGSREYPDGSWFIDFSALTEPELVARAVAAALEIRDAAGASSTEAIVRHLHSRRALLIFDNCEHLLPAVAAAASAILHGCPGVEILATSRERLGLAEEWAVRVPSLGLPEPGGATLASIREAPATQLFLSRVAGRSTGVAITEEDAPHVARLCARLDGLPLALELAAAWGGILSARDLAERLDDRFALLTRGARGAPARHQTLQAAIEWSTALLSPAERQLFVALSVFAGSFDLAAAEAVAGGSAPANQIGVLSGIASLVEKSLIVAQPRHPGARYSMLESLRAYGRGQLERDGETMSALQRFADHYAEKAAAVRTRIRTGAQAEVIAEVALDHENYRTALQWLSGNESWGGYFSIATGIWQYWDVTGAGSEARHWLARGLAEASHTSVPPALVARALGCLGQSLWRFGQLEEAEAHELRALEVYEEIDDAPGVAWVNVNLGGIFYARSDFVQAKDRWERALESYTALKDDRQRAILFNNLGLIADREGAAALAVDLLSESAAIRRNLQDFAGLSSSLLNLASIAGREGRTDNVRSLAGEALSIARRLNQRLHIGLALIELASASLRTTEFDSANQQAAEALAEFCAGGYRAEEAAARAVLACIARERGEFPEAATHHGDALSLRHSLGDGVEVGQSLLGIAALAIDLGDVPLAARLLGGVSAIQLMGTLPPGADDYEATAMRARAAAASAERFVSDFAEGASQPVQQLVAEALRWLPAAGRRAGKSQGHSEGFVVGAEPLTAREASVLAALAAGSSNKEIARALEISVRTVERHLANVYAKLGARGRADAIRFALAQENTGSPFAGH